MFKPIWIVVLALAFSSACGVSAKATGDYGLFYNPVEIENGLTRDALDEEIKIFITKDLESDFEKAQSKGYILLGTSDLENQKTNFINMKQITKQCQRIGATLAYYTLEYLDSKNVEIEESNDQSDSMTNNTVQTNTKQKSNSKKLKQKQKSVRQSRTATTASSQHRAYDEDVNIYNIKVYYFIKIPAAKSALGLSLRETTGGLFIDDLVPASAADRAGLQKGDVIFQIDNRPIRDITTLDAFLRKLPDDQKLRIEFTRSINGIKTPQEIQIVF